MKKISLFIATVFAMAIGGFAQTSEIAPNLIKTPHNSNKAAWDVQLNIPPNPIGSNLAGVIWTGTEFWLARWNAATIYTADATGTSTGSFTIPGVTETRSFTTDGTDIYIGTAGTSIYKINITTKSLTSTINTSVAICRYLTYDPTLDNNAGGFWTGNYSTDITAISMTGATLSTINAATHGLSGIYGLAYDDITTGGPYLWAADQGNGECDLVQLSMTGVPTGLTHQANTDVGASGSLAGGLFICNNFVTGKSSMIGIAQGSSLFSYELSDPLPIDAKMEALNIPVYVAAGNVTISGTVKNNGLNTLTSIDIDWNDGTAHNETFTVNIPSNGTYNFTHGTTLAVIAGNSYTVNVTVNVTSDGNTANNSLTTNASALTSVPKKVNVGEEKTGAWCGWCPRGAVGLANMESENDFIGIAVHNRDPMVVAAYDGKIGTYIPSGYPRGGVDRVVDGNPSPSGFLAMHNARKNTVVPCDVKNVVLAVVGGQLSVSADSEWYGSISGNYRLSCVIVEDDVISVDQTNYYAGGKRAGSMPFPAGKNNSYNFGGASSPAKVPSSDFLGYDHVAVSLSSNNILGTPNSLPTTTVPVGIHSFTFPDVPATVVGNINNAHAIVMVVNANTGEILNAAKSNSIVSVEDIEDAKFQVNIYPNPTQGETTIAFELNGQNTVTLEVYNAMGSLVYTENQGVMNPGSHKLTYDGNSLINGFYFVNLTIGNQVISKKVTVFK